MNRVSFFIDGFNMYHSLKEHARDCRWLNLRTLCQEQINPDKEEISGIFYFSAIATWLSDANKVSKHKKYISRLQQENVNIVLGKFKEKEIHCKVCGSFFRAHEEKQTDVNIALKILEESVLDSFDTAILVSGDTDMIPAIMTMKRLFPGKRIGVVFPLGRKTLELSSVADFSRKISREQLRRCLFEPSLAPDGWVPDSEKR